MTDLRAVPPPASRPSRRIIVKSHAEKIREDLLDGKPTRWRSDTPLADWWAEWRPAILGAGLFLLRVGLLTWGVGFAAWPLLRPGQR